MIGGMLFVASSRTTNDFALIKTEHLTLNGYGESKAQTFKNTHSYSPCAIQSESIAYHKSLCKLWQ